MRDSELEQFLRHVGAKNFRAWLERFGPDPEVAFAVALAEARREPERPSSRFVLAHVDVLRRYAQDVVRQQRLFALRDARPGDSSHDWPDPTAEDTPPTRFVEMPDTLLGDAAPARTPAPPPSPTPSASPRRDVPTAHVSLDTTPVPRLASPRPAPRLEAPPRSDPPFVLTAQPRAEAPRQGAQDREATPPPTPLVLPHPRITTAGATIEPSDEDPDTGGSDAAPSSVPDKPRSELRLMPTPAPAPLRVPTAPPAAPTSASRLRLPAVLATLGGAGLLLALLILGLVLPDLRAPETPTAVAVAPVAPPPPPVRAEMDLVGAWSGDAWTLDVLDVQGSSVAARLTRGSDDTATSTLLWGDRSDGRLRLAGQGITMELEAKGLQMSGTLVTEGKRKASTPVVLRRRSAPILSPYEVGGSTPP
jgi:hypothetical protein